MVEKEKEKEMVYRVVVRRDPEDARFWLADVQGIDGAHTSARSLVTLDRYVREVIVLAADLPDEMEDELELAWDYHTGNDALDEAAAKLRKQREEIEARFQQLANQTKELARRLVTEGGYSVRDTAKMLAISASRVDQVAAHSHHRARRRVKA